MGSRSITPRAPIQPQIVYVPQATTSVNETTSQTESEDSSVLSDEQKSETRSNNLLRRDRSRLGTILSGFRGVLGLSDDAPARKSLLGE